VSQKEKSEGRKGTLKPLDAYRCSDKWDFSDDFKELLLYS